MKKRCFVLTFEEDDDPPFEGGKAVQHRFELIEVESLRWVPAKGVMKFAMSEISHHNRYNKLDRKELRRLKLAEMMGKLFVKAENESTEGTDALLCLPKSYFENRAKRMEEFEEKIQEELTRIVDDDRLTYPPAKVEINAPLALIQVELKAMRTAYLKVQEWLKSLTT